MSGLKVLNPGVLSLIQDKGRFGQHAIGLTTGGPADPAAAQLLTKLLGNNENQAFLEISFGGFEAEAQQEMTIACGGGDIPVSINGEPIEHWRTYQLKTGDKIKFGFAQKFCRTYLMVHGGLSTPLQFGSHSTVVREGIGGIDGRKLEKGDTLPCTPGIAERLSRLPADALPSYCNDICVRVVPGYQIEHFSRVAQQVFFSSRFTVTDRADRMGYRLEGPRIDCEIEGILSEGICQGAIQVPADGQPIVLLNDRQTIGGYPKIGSAFSLDAGKLAQLTAGASVSFERISAEEAQRLLLMHRYRLDHLMTETIDNG